MKTDVHWYDLILSRTGPWVSPRSRWISPDLGEYPYYSCFTEFREGTNKSESWTSRADTPATKLVANAKNLEVGIFGRGKRW